MITDTPIFRGALSVAIAWLMIFGFITYHSYRENYKSVYLAAFEVPENYTENCSDEIIDWGDANLTRKKPSPEETRLCLKIATDVYQNIIRANNEFEFRRSWIDFLQRGLTPALILLTIVALWRSLVSRIVFIGQKYGMWLRYGFRKNID